LADRSAQNLANRGSLVVAIILGIQNYKPGPNKPPPKGPGHIAVIMPADRSETDLTDLGPAEAQAGTRNYTTTRIKTGFTGHLPDPTSVMRSIGVTTDYMSPVIQFFFNTQVLSFH
jgi:hypothetical protein